MNVYFVSAGEVTKYDYYQIEPPETFFLVELVAAETRSKATYMVWKKHLWDLGDLHEQRWQTKLIAQADRPVGILDENDELWQTENLPDPRDLRK